MNYELLAWLGSIILTIGAVWKIVEKYSPRIRWALKLSGETLDLVNTVLNAFDDRKITKQEIEQIANEIEQIQDILKGTK